MIEFANGVFNPKHVAFVGIDPKRPWRSGWAVTITFSSGASVIEEAATEAKARYRFAQIQQQVENAG